MSFLGLYFGRKETRERGQASFRKNWTGRAKIPHVILHGLEHKSCAHCCALKPLDEFRKSSSLDKLDSWCRDCRKEAERERAKSKKAVEVSE